MCPEKWEQNFLFYLCVFTLLERHTLSYQKVVFLCQFSEPYIRKKKGSFFVIFYKLNQKQFSKNEFRNTCKTPYYRNSKGKNINISTMFNQFQDFEITKDCATYKIPKYKRTISTISKSFALLFSVTMTKKA